MTYGRLYFADVNELGDLENEIAEISFGYDLPTKLTYEIIQPYLFEKINDLLNTGKI